MLRGVCMFIMRAGKKLNRSGDNKLEQDFSHGRRFIGVPFKSPKEILAGISSVPENSFGVNESL